jgi:DNA-binding response OmpR family regulator
MLKVMLIDSDRHGLRTLGEELEKDYAVLACDQGQRAFELYKLFSPDAVVLDPLIPGLGPENFISKMRSLPGRPPLKVIVLSYSALIKQIEESFDWGADYYFFKPVVANRVRFKLREVLQNQSPRMTRQTELNFLPGTKKGTINGDLTTGFLPFNQTKR